LADNPIHDPSPPDSVDSSEVSTQTEAPAAPAAGSLGPYRLLQKIGSGGMGDVWLAEQSAPFRRNVAIKVIKAGMDTREVVARFEAERQALALMNHPAIAKVYDAGETPRGLPYFAMEYVKGEAITRYCDRHRLANRDRLALFIEICAGVQHAHQKGIIHRDLKPSNVLVTILDGKPTPKIIDFGVAKATALRLTERTIFTELGVLIGTPEYMSPEQAEMTGLDVDTRTDVYSLGIMLYELMVGALPFESADLRKAGYDEIRRQIREVDPPRPSTRISSLGGKAVTAAHNRRTEPGRLVSQLKRDLDWITMKALEKDRTRRYGSPQEMAEDIVRHLSDQPVLAGRPSALYRAGKFGRRHRFGVAVAALGLVALLGFAVTMAVEARSIARQKIRAERVSEFLTGLFNVSDPSEARGNSVTAREILDKGSEQIRRELAAEPEVEAQLALTMGNVYAKLGLYSKAEPLLRTSIELRQKMLGPDAVDTLGSMDSLAFMLLRKGQDPDAEKLYRQVVEGRTKRLGAENPDTLSSMHGLGVALEHLQRYKESGQIKLQVYKVRLRLLGENNPDTLQSMNDVASVYWHEHRLAEAESLFRKTLEARQRLQGADHPDTLWVMNNLGIILHEQKRLPEAEKVFIQTLELRRRVMGEEHRDTLVTMGNLAMVYYDEGRKEEAGRLLAKTVEASRRVLGEDSPKTLGWMNNLAVLYLDQGRKKEAADLIAKSLDASRRALGEGDPNTLALTDNLAAIYVEDGRYREAERMYLDLIEVQHRVLGEDHPDLQNSYYNLACTEALLGRRDKAFAYLRRAVELGFHDPDTMTKDHMLDSLRPDPGFEALLAIATKNAASPSK
jgi:eukaryotic-like serine/threonine-protein kinase